MPPILLWGRFSLEICYLSDLKIPVAITHQAATAPLPSFMVKIVQSSRNL